MPRLFGDAEVAHATFGSSTTSAAFQPPKTMEPASSSWPQLVSFQRDGGGGTSTAPAMRSLLLSHPP